MPVRTPLNPEIHKELEKDRTGYIEDPRIVATYRDYLAGKHTMTLTTEQKTWLRGVLSNQFCDNITHHITAEARDRLRFIRYESQDEAVSKFLGNFYIMTKVAQRQNQIHYDALGEGNTVVALGFDNERGIVTLIDEEWWDGKSGVFIAYDDLWRVKYAVKEWNEDESLLPEKANYRTRRNIWIETADACWMEMWIGNGVEWEPFTETNRESEEDRGPVVPWMVSSSEKMHIPYVHFPNVDRGSDVYGVSEIGGGVLGFQDQLNDIQYALSAIGRTTAFQMYWGSGVKPKKDTNGNDIEPEFGPGQFLYSGDAAARFGVLQAGDVQNMVILYRTKLQSVARMTRTPLHIITGGDWPSGEALLRSELPAIGKAEGQIETFRNCWAQVGHRAVEIWNRFGKGPKLDESIENAQITTRFADPEKRDFVTRVTMAQMLKDIVSPQEKLRVLGKTDEEITKIMEEMDEEKSKIMDEQLKTMEAQARVAAANRPPSKEGA